MDYLHWNPFNDPNDAEVCESTDYVWPGAQEPQGSEFFQDHELLELAGALAMESADLEAIEAWVCEAAAAKLDDDVVQPKRDRARDLRGEQQDAKRKAAARLEPAMLSNDRDDIRTAITKAARAGAHPERLMAAGQRLEALKHLEAKRLRDQSIVDARTREKEDEVLVASVTAKLEGRTLLPSPSKLSEKEQAALERQHMIPRSREPTMSEIKFVFPNGEVESVRVNLADQGTCLLTKLLPLKRQHGIPKRLGLFLPSGELVQMDKPLEAQGVEVGITIRVDDVKLGTLARDPEQTPVHCEREASSIVAATANQLPPETVQAAKRTEDSLSSTKITRSGEKSEEVERWMPVYNALVSSMLDPAEVTNHLRSRSTIVVLGWGALDDSDIMSQSVEAFSSTCGLTGSCGALLVVTGVTEALHKLTCYPSVEAFLPLQLPLDTASRKLGQSVARSLIDAGVQGPMAFVAVSRCFRSRRLVKALCQYGPSAPLDRPWETVAVIPYCGDPQFSRATDVHERPQEILIEADRMLQTDPWAFSASEWTLVEQLATEVFGADGWLPRKRKITRSTLCWNDDEPDTEFLNTQQNRHDAKGLDTLDSEVKGAESYIEKTVTRAPHARVTTSRVVQESEPRYSEERLMDYPLARAVRTGDVKGATKLAQEGASVNSSDRFGDTPLCLAVTASDANMAASLLFHAADPGLTSWSGKHPSREASTDCVRALLDIFSHKDVGAQRKRLALNGLHPSLRFQLKARISDMAFAQVITSYKGA